MLRLFIFNFEVVQKFEAGKKKEVILDRDHEQSELIISSSTKKVKLQFHII